jgi:hypothetical protein
MSNTAFWLTAVLVFLSLVFMMFFVVVAVKSSYRNGVRDGYQNTWLPSVKRQVQEEGLMQGEAVSLPLDTDVK